MQAITQDIWVETQFLGCNVGFVSTSEGIVMIDTPMRPSDALKCKAEIEKHGQVRYIILTEHHPDHILGSFFFSAPIICHQGTAQEMSRVAANLDEIKGELRQTDPEGAHLLENYQMRRPTITFTHWLHLHMGKYTFHLENMPGHVANEVGVYIPEAKVLFSGDNVAHGHYPWMHECVPLGWLETIKRMGQMDINAIVPGHGTICDKGVLGPLTDYLNATFNKIRDGIQAGKSSDQIVAELPFPPRFSIHPAMETRMRKMHETGVRRVYDQLKKAAG